MAFSDSAIKRYRLDRELENQNITSEAKRRKNGRGPCVSSTCAKRNKSETDNHICEDVKEVDQNNCLQIELSWSKPRSSIYQKEFFQPKKVIENTFTKN